MKTNDEKREKGKVKWFNASKGFGFIAREGQKDVFIHLNQLPDGVENLKEGQPLSFVVETTNKGNGIRAVNIQLEPN